MTDDRYSRQWLFHEIGREGQKRIRDARVAVIGCGALGSVSAEILVRAGVGRLLIVDRDFVEESNLQRQSLFTEQDAQESLPKAIAAQKSLSRLNSEVSLEGVVCDLTSRNITELLKGFEVLVDGTDNFAARFLVNDFAFREGVPWVYGGCVAAHGIAGAFVPGKTACLQCLFEEPPAGAAETCETAGVIGPAVHLVAAYQTTQVMKWLVSETVSELILQFDLWGDQFRTISLTAARREDCLCCGMQQFRYLEGSCGSEPLVLCGRNAVQVTPDKPGRIDFDRFSEKLSAVAEVRRNEYLMLIRVPGYEISLFPDGRAIVKGASDPAAARSVYSRYIGC